MPRVMNNKVKLTDYADYDFGFIDPVKKPLPMVDSIDGLRENIEHAVDVQAERNYEKWYGKKANYGGVYGHCQ